MIRVPVHGHPVCDTPLRGSSTGWPLNRARRVLIIVPPYSVDCTRITVSSRRFFSFPCRSPARRRRRPLGGGSAGEQVGSYVHTRARPAAGASCRLVFWHPALPSASGRHCCLATIWGGGHGNARTPWAPRGRPGRTPACLSRPLGAPAPSAGAASHCHAALTMIRGRAQPRPRPPGPQQVPDCRKRGAWCVKACPNAGRHATTHTDTRHAPRRDPGRAARSPQTRSAPPARDLAAAASDAADHCAFAAALALGHPRRGCQVGHGQA
jgi:hypothetical protein